ncbi:MAG: hypothetical protein GXP32_04270 [Kiritimatiellaeota bacterium]|nr:hypothetical protein [Kiritimatiellota bacterium]
MRDRVSSNIPLCAVILLSAAVSCARMSDDTFPSKADVADTPAKPPPPPPPLTSSELKVLRIIGGKILPNGDIAIGKVRILRRGRMLSFPAETSITTGDLEVLICSERGRAYESLLKSSVNPYNVQLGILLLGGVNGARLKTLESQSTPQGTLVDVFVLLPDGKVIPIEKWLRNKRTGKMKKREGWVFVGSSFAGDKSCLATKEGNVANTWSFGNTILDNPAHTGDYDDYFEAYTKNIPKDVEKVTVLMKPR